MRVPQMMSRFAATTHTYSPRPLKGTRSCWATQRNGTSAVGPLSASPRPRSAFARITGTQTLMAPTPGARARSTGRARQPCAAVAAQVGLPALAAQQGTRASPTTLTVEPAARGTWVKEATEEALFGTGGRSAQVCVFICPAVVLAIHGGRGALAMQACAHGPWPRKRVPSTASKCLTFFHALSPLVCAQCGRALSEERKARGAWSADMALPLPSHETAMRPRSNCHRCHC